MTKILLSLSG